MDFFCDAKYIKSSESWLTVKKYINIRICIGMSARIRAKQACRSHAVLVQQRRDNATKLIYRIRTGGHDAPI